MKFVMRVRYVGDPTFADHFIARTGTVEIDGRAKLSLTRDPSAAARFPIAIARRLENRNGNPRIVMVPTFEFEAEAKTRS